LEREGLMTWLLAAGIGVIAGLRSMTAPAVVAWAAYLGWIHLQGSPLSFMGSIWVVGLFTLAALAEFVVDQLPQTPARTAPGPLLARIVTGGLCGSCLAVAGGQSLLAGALLGAVGGVAGAFVGYQARTGLVRGLHVPDRVIAIPEDLIAVVLGVLFVSRFR
jgi:uncharacterized membrane protein